jgi:RHS repeat-associated protein
LHKQLPLVRKYKISIGTASFITGAAIGPVSLTFMPTATNMTLTIRKVAPVGGAIAQLGIKYISYDRVSVQPYTAVSKICSEYNHHYGYNGQMRVNEFAGKGNHYTYGFRDYDTRICRPRSPDPLFKKFPNLSSYQFFSNTPIWATDLDGLEAYFSTNGTFIRWGDDKTEKAPVFSVSSDNIQQNIGLNVKEFLDR